jgi:hypothetical protein
MNSWALERAASYGTRWHARPLALVRLAPAGDPLTEGVPPPNGAIGVYDFRTAVQVKRVRPRVDLARFRAQFAAILARDVPGASLVDVNVSVGGESREGGVLHWWVTVDGRAAFRTAWTVDRFNYALTEALCDATTWSPDTASPSDPVWDFAARSANAHPNGAPTSRVAGNVLLNVFRDPRACLGAIVDVAGSPWVRACTRVLRVGNVTEVVTPAPTPDAPSTQPPESHPSTNAGRWIAGAVAAGLATGVAVYAVTR